MKIGKLEVYGIIYKLTNKVNKKIYIGQTIVGYRNRYSRGGDDNVSLMYNYHLKNKEDGYYYNRHILSAMNKYGLESFEVNDCLDIAFSKEELDIKEDMWIRYYNSVENGYNEKYGGASGKASEKTRKLMSLQRRGEGNHMYGKNHSEETRKKLKKNHWSRTGKYKPPVLRGEEHPCFGRKHSKETKEKIRKSNLGKEVSDETKRKISESRMGKDNPTAKAVICVNFQEIFDTVAEASKKYSFDSSGLCACCNVKQKHKGVYNGEKLSWMYLDNWSCLDFEEKKRKYIDSKISGLITGRVICETTGKIFDTINDASRKYNLDRHRLSKKCKENKPYGKSNGDELVWNKYDKYIMNKYGSLEAFIEVSFIMPKIK